MNVEAKTQRIERAVLAILIVLIAGASASSDVGSAVSPDQKFRVELGDCNDFGCKVELKNVGNREVLASLNV